LAERPSRIYPWLGVVAVVLGVGAAGWVVWDQNRPRVEAPTEAQVCWRMDMAGGKPRFTVLSRRVDNLESCAANLEGMHMDTGGPVRGAYQGRFIFVDADAIQSSPTLDGARWRIFWGPQREALRKKIIAQRRRVAMGLPAVPPPPP
jgi:hypothetical protein